jgi:hypothetical protein
MQTFEAEGYAILPDILSARECAEFLACLSSPQVPRSRAGARHLLALPSVAALATDPRLVRIASHALGKDALPFRVTLFHKALRSDWSVVWHQDTALPLSHRFEKAGWGPWSTKSGVVYAHAPSEALERVVALRVHLDASLATNGPLRVLPSTHSLGVLSDDQVSMLAQSMGAEGCVVSCGGVLAMRPLLIHSSARLVTLEPRRILHLE